MILVGCTWAAKPPKPGRAPPAAPAPAEAPLPALLPVLDGPTEIPTGDGFVRETATVSFTFDLTALDALDARGVDALFALLAAAPEWRVGITADGRVATRHGAGSPGLAGWNLAGPTCTRAVLSESTARAFAGPRVVVVPTSTHTVAAPAFRPTDGPEPCRSWATALVFDGATLDLAVFEAGAADARPFTLDTLQTLAPPVSLARVLADKVLALGHDPDAPVLPAGPARLEAGPEPGTVTAEAWLNPGAPGRTWLRLLDARGAPWAETEVGSGTVQQIGWSADPERRFRAGSVFRAPAGPGFSGTAEWWFQGADGVPRRLDAQKVNVPAR